LVFKEASERDSEVFFFSRAVAHLTNVQHTGWIKALILVLFSLVRSKCLQFFSVPKATTSNVMAVI